MSKPRFDILFLGLTIWMSRKLASNIYIIALWVCMPQHRHCVCLTWRRSFVIDYDFYLLLKTAFPEMDMSKYRPKFIQPVHFRTLFPVAGVTCLCGGRKNTPRFAINAFVYIFTFFYFGSLVNAIRWIKKTFGAAMRLKPLLGHIECCTFCYYQRKSNRDWCHYPSHLCFRKIISPKYVIQYQFNINL